MTVTDAAGTVSRVSYREGQVVTAADLIAEQSYLIAMRQRHASANHSWGIAEGLDLSIDDGTLSVARGMAVDGLGRLLIVPETVKVATADLRGEDVSVWLVYVQEPAGAVPDRLREVTKIRLCTGAVPAPRQAEATGGEWPVYLGGLHRAGATGTFTAKPDGRPLIGLVGEDVRAASGAALLRCGETFAVALPASGGEPDAFTDKLKIGRNGNLRILADVRLTGDVRVQPNVDLTPSGSQGVGFGTAIAPPEAAWPWRVYRAQAPRDHLPALDELVFELQGPHEKEDPAGLRATLGCPKDGKFQAALAVASDGNVTVQGVLRVEGRLIESPIAADPSDPRFVVAMAEAAAGGATDVLPGALEVEVAAGKSTVHTAVDYTLTFHNTGREAIQVIQVQVFATLDGKLAMAPTEPIPGFILGAGAKYPVPPLPPLSIDTAGKVAIGVRVVGSAASGPVSAKHAVEIQVT